MIQKIFSSPNFTRYTVAIPFVSGVERIVIHVISLYEMGFRDINITSINDIVYLIQVVFQSIQCCILQLYESLHSCKPPVYNTTVNVVEYF